ncbi:MULTISPECIES: ABC transporter ATP-binding protein [unclassified Streptomyces]|uniref:ABC transporter ATP-binding protein n=1 Tax=unclassified Streptomyces TaxID=2593676 RepID=UPI001660AFA7|nr:MULTISPECIES: ABC transporter ATP-binding protein [unclassified Streptomyces]MBD0712465.1 ABC transporter ATP-binding protein [Streptomyces sp. CBMA291]MBD0716839.1 ABC transporter ATP-binding protein [Streptomyces sp. CBMA370]
MTHDTALAADRLGKKYGRRGDWALRECDLSLPQGRICALVGPNGAGKSTFLALAAGLLRPTEGTLTTPGRALLAYVAQDKPLHPRLSVDDTLRMGRELNPGRWDDALARQVLEGGGFSSRTLVHRLSGGQRTRVALALALGKRPELLLLDEPMADLDPLARRRLMGLLMAEAAENGTTVVMSSHILTELENACDHLLLLHGGRILLDGSIEELLSTHTLLTGPVADLAPHHVVESRTTGRQLTALIRREGPVDGPWETSEPSLEELLLAHLRTTEGVPA